MDVILYFLPINARIREMDLDTTVINAIAAYAPVIPVMTRVRTLLLAIPFHTTTLSFVSSLIPEPSNRVTVR